LKFMVLRLEFNVCEIARPDHQLKFSVAGLRSKVAFRLEDLLFVKVDSGERSRQTRTFRGVTYPESYITKCTTYTKINGVGHNLCVLRRRPPTRIRPLEIQRVVERESAPRLERAARARSMVVHL